MADRALPRDEAGLADLVRGALASAECVRVCGGDTKEGFGLPVEAPIEISTAALTGIVDYEPEELVMSACAGTPLDEIEAALSAHGQRLAFEPPRLGPLYGRAECGTIGGVFMGNLSGPRRFCAGAARDHILGMRAVNGRGEIYRAGGRVIKNVTGYDLPRLMAGSWGTLSILSEITFKVVPAAERTATLVIPDLDPGAALALMRTIAASPLEATGLAYLPAAPAARLPRLSLPQDRALAFVRVEGTAAGLDGRLDALNAAVPDTDAGMTLGQEETHALWAALRDAAPFAKDAALTLMRLSIPPARATDMAAYLDSLPDCTWYADAAGGWFWLGLGGASPAAAARAVRERIAGDGAAVIFRAPVAVRREAGVLSGANAALAALARRIKQSFDPAGLFNPGRLYPH